MIIHHSASPKSWTTIEDLNRWHKNRGFRKSSFGYNVGYHRVITDGKIIKTRDINEPGAHTIGHNNEIGVCVIGNYQNEKPEAGDIVALLKLIRELKPKEIKGHRDYSKTLCPGDNLYKWVKFFKKLTKIYHRI